MGRRDVIYNSTGLQVLSFFIQFTMCAYCQNPKLPGIEQEIHKECTHSEHSFNIHLITLL